MDVEQRQQRKPIRPRRALSLLLSTTGWIAGALGAGGLGWATYLIILYVRFHSFDTRHGGLPTLMAGGGLVIASSILMTLGVLLVVIGQVVDRSRKANPAVKASMHT